MTHVKIAPAFRRADVERLFARAVSSQSDGDDRASTFGGAACDGPAAGVALKLDDGTGPYAFNCGAPAFRFTEDRLRGDIGPRLVAMVRDIQAALGGAATQSKKQSKNG